MEDNVRRRGGDGVAVPEGLRSGKDAAHTYQRRLGAGDQFHQGFPAPKTVTQSGRIDPATTPELPFCGHVRSPYFRGPRSIPSPHADAAQPDVDAPVIAAFEAVVTQRGR